MPSAPIPAFEAERLSSLRNLRILDTAPEAAFDDLTVLASLICQTPIAVVTLIDADRQWFKSRVGLTQEETPRSIAFCAHTILEQDLLIVQDALEDKRFSDNPVVTSQPFVRFYAGMPLVSPEGYAVGALCTIDLVPRTLSDEQMDALRILGRQAATHFQLRQSHMRLREMEALRDATVHMMVHDLRSPLTSIIGAIENLSELGPLEEGQKEMVRVAQAESQRLIAMTGDMLDISRMEDRSFRLKVEDVAIRDLIEQEARSSVPVAEEKRISIMTDVAPDVGKVLGNERALQRVLDNLLTNAIRHTPSGGSITISALKAGQSEVAIAVSDTGEGMSKHDVEHVFDKFYQGSERAHGGSAGLGLTYCKLAVEAMGGSIVVASELGKGTKFEIRLAASD